MVLTCLGDFAGDYCKELAAAGQEGSEPYCELLPECVAQGFVPPACRPAKCPLKEEGCERIRNCLRGGVMDLYAQMMAGTGGEGVTAAAAGGGGSGEASAGASSSWGGWFGNTGGKQGGGGGGGGGAEL